MTTPRRLGHYTKAARQFRDLGAFGIYVGNALYVLDMMRPRDPGKGPSAFALKYGYRDEDAKLANPRVIAFMAELVSSHGVRFTRLEQMPRFAPEDFKDLFHPRGAGTLKLTGAMVRAARPALPAAARGS